MNKIFKAQVAGAFYKEGLGEIDLVWGEIADKLYLPFYHKTRCKCHHQKAKKRA